MIIHIFNSSIVSGPETLVIPQLSQVAEDVAVVFLTESRKGAAGKTPIAYAEQFGLRVYEVSINSRYDKHAIEELSSLLSLLSPEILHAHDVKASAYVYWASKKLVFGKKPILVSTHHGVRGRRGFKIKLYEKFYTHFILPHYDATLAVCSSDREILIKRGLPENKVFLHLNGVDRPYIENSKRVEISSSIRKKWGRVDLLDDSKKVVLGYVGRLSSEKGILRLLKVLKLLAIEEEALSWELLVFGKGAQESQLKEFVRNLGLLSRVSFMGYRAEVGSEMAGLDLLVSLSPAEGLPINLLEAGWAGTPVFHTAVDGVCDLLNWGVKSFLVNVDSTDREISTQLGSVIRDSSKREQFALEFQEHVRSQFSSAVWGRRLVEIYCELKSRR